MAIPAVKPTRVVILHEVKDKPVKTGVFAGSELCFQCVRYELGNGKTYDGYRFIWRGPDTHLHTDRGQARLPSLGTIRKLLRDAEQKGWGNLIAEEDSGWQFALPKALATPGTEP